MAFNLFPLVETGQATDALTSASQLKDPRSTSTGSTSTGSTSTGSTSTGSTSTGSTSTASFSPSLADGSVDPLTGTALATGGGGSGRLTTAAKGGGGAPLPPPPPTLSASPSFLGNRINTITNGDWNAEFSIDRQELQHLLRLIHAGGVWGGPITGIDRNGASFVVSGVRAINSYGNHTSTTAKNAVGTPAQYWANPDTAYVRMTNAQYGRAEGSNGAEALGKPRGYLGTVATVDADRKVSFIAMTEATDQFSKGGLRNSRTISNMVGEQSVATPNSFGVNVFHMSAGQYIDHGVDFTGRSPSSQSFGAAVGELTDNLNTPRTGVVGNQAASYLRDASSQQLVQVLWMKNPDNTEGLYELLAQPDGSFKQGRLANAILGRDAVANDVLFLNKTESLFQANQTYGSSAATAYLLRETARFDAQGRYTYSWTVGRLTETRSLTGKPGDLVWDSNAYGTSKAGYIKTAESLSTRVRMGDGLPGIPTYAEILLNNGVHAAVIKLALNPTSLSSADADYLLDLAGQSGGALTREAIQALINQAKADGGLSTPAWQSVAQWDSRYVNNGNVMDFDPRSATFGLYAGHPLNGDLSPAVNAISKTSPFLLGSDQNLDNITDLNLDGTPKSGQPGITAEDWGAGSLLSHLCSGDWRSNENAGLATTHSIWLREHNFLVARIRAAITEVAPDWSTLISDDDVFEMAREIVIGEYQKMVYTEYLPNLAGTWGGIFGLADTNPFGSHGWGGYNPLCDPSTSLEFATAAFRTPHSTIPQQLIPGIDLFSLFLAPQSAMALGPTAITDGLLKAASEALDTKLVDAVRDNLVTQRLDLLAANTMRNRALGISDYESMKAQLFTTGPLNRANGSDFTSFTIGNVLFKPDQNWAEFGTKLRDWQPSRRSGKVLTFNVNDPATYGTSNLRDRFMYLYGGHGNADATTNATTGNITYNVTGITNQQLQGAKGLNTIDAYIAMLAEKPTADTGQVGPLASYLIWENADRQQEGDSMYYLDRLKENGPNVWSELDTFGTIIDRTSTPQLALALDVNQEGIYKVQANINPLSLSSYQANYLTIGSQLQDIWNLSDPWASAVAANVGLNPMDSLS